MHPVFEAKYLAIQWFDKNTVSKISESRYSIKIEYLDDVTYSAEIQTYKRIQNGLDTQDGQVAFRIFNNNKEINPYFLNAKQDRIPLLKIIDPDTKKEWWIENGKWNGKYRETELWNHVGETTVYFGNISCHISISTISFTREQLNLYLDDFKNDFWYLILKKDSLTKAKAKNKKEEIKILNNKTIKYYYKFIEYIKNVLKNPKKELTEVQALKDIKRVKPVPRTFMEIASSGYKRKLTSRDTVESHNVPENKYIHYALNQVYTIVLNMTRVSDRINNFYKNKIKSDNERLSLFKDYKVINQTVLNNEINDCFLQVEIPYFCKKFFPTPVRNFFC